MNYKPTIVNISTGLLITVNLMYTWVNYETLTAGEGWGIVAMFGISGFGIFILFIDLLLQQLIKNNKILNLIGAVIIIAAALALLQ